MLRQSQTILSKNLARRVEDRKKRQCLPSLHHWNFEQKHVIRTYEFTLKYDTSTNTFIYQMEIILMLNLLLTDISLELPLYHVQFYNWILQKVSLH